MKIKIKKRIQGFLVSLLLIPVGLSVMLISVPALLFFILGYIKGIRFLDVLLTKLIGLIK